MADNHVEFDLSEINDFVAKLEQAAKGDFRKELAVWMQGLGAEFLKIVQDEIIRLKVMDTRLLLASFHQGTDDSIWEISDGGLTLEVGTNVKYGAAVNDGYWTVKENTRGAFRTKNDGKKIPKGTLVRFVPGYWQNNRFIYDPKAKTGMMLKQKWVEGKHYWDSAVNIFEKMFPDIIEAKLQEWLDKYFE